MKKLKANSKKVDFINFIEKNTLRCEVSYRGGGIEIDVSGLFGNGCKMTAYQNYLGGGIAGAICSDCNWEVPQKHYKLFDRMRGELKEYFYSLNGGGGDEYMVENINSYMQNQSLPKSAY